MNKATSMTIDGEEWVRADSIADHSGEVRIVIGQRGWVWVGYWAQDGETVTLSRAKNIRKWGTTQGLGELVDGPLGATVLDPAGTVTMHILGVVATLHADRDAWAGHL